MEMQQVNTLIGVMTAWFAMDDIVQTPDDDFFRLLMTLQSYA